VKKIVLNLKMHLNLEEMNKYQEEITKIANHNPEIIVAPSYPFLYLFNNPNYLLGAQDVSQFIEGSYTGEVSAKQLASMGVKYAIINHSERKKIAFPTDDIILSKIKNALNAGIKVILCIGETYEEKKINKTFPALRNRLIKIFNQINREDLKNIIIAYEPEWAIGTGISANSYEIDALAAELKKEIFRNYDKDMEILYGGSVNSYNITNLAKMVNVDGFLLGSASIDLKELNDILLMCIERY
jgi:triosephosphate isomerase